MKKGLLVVLLFFSYLVINSQETAVKKDLKVGLVLSGGGAKGFAHVGVLKALEEAGVRIDYIGGTSMGAIVGSLYASGYSADAIETIIKDFKFYEHIPDEISRKSKPFYQKEIDDKYSIKLPVKAKKVQIPSGLSDGQIVLNILSKFTQHVNTITDFNKLPIPFLCIATDLENGKQVLLNSGYLPEAVRASSAYPTLLKPIEIDGKLLVDGGIVNNFPVDEVKAMGADIIIGVDVSASTLLKKEELNSVLNILDQIVSYQMMTKEDLDKKNRTDIFIRPDISGYSVMSFDKGAEIIQVGLKAGKENLAAFKEIAKKQTTPPKKFTPVKVPEKFTVKSIHIEGNKNYTYGYIIEKLQIRLGKQISFEEFFNGIDRLSATGNFINIQQKIYLTKDDACNISIKLTENKVDTYVQAGAHYDPIFKAGILLNITSKHLLFKNDFLSADVIVGEKPRYNITYFVDNGIHLSIGLQSVYQNFDFDTFFLSNNSDFYLSDNFINLDFLNLSNELFFQGIYKDNFAVRLGLEHQFIRALNKNNDENNLFIEKSNYLIGSGLLRFDTFDERTFPKSGMQFEGNLKWYFYSSDFQENFIPFVQGRAKFSYALTLKDRLTAQINSEAGISMGDNVNPYLGFYLGGVTNNYKTNFGNFYGYPFAGIGNNSYLKTAFTLRYELFNKHFLSTTANFARTEEDLLNNGAIFENTKKGYALEYGIKSLVGPIILTYAYSPDIKKNYWNFKIGYWF